MRFGRIAEAAAWAVSVVGWALSFRTEMALASLHGFTGWEPAAWASTPDLGGLVGMVLALDAGRRRRPSWGPWSITVISAAVMVAANVGAAAGDPVAMMLHAWPPVVALMSWGVLVHARRADGVVEAAPEMAQERVEQSAGDPPASSHETADRPTAPAPGRPRTAAELRSRVGRLLLAEPSVSSGKVASRLGISRSHAGRLLRDARRMHVATQGDAQ